MRKVLLSLAGSLVLTSCMTYDPYTDEKKVSSATTGAVIGAVAGAVLGNQVKGSKVDRERARIAGAALGAAIGGAVGQSKDKKEAALRQRLRNTGVAISKSEDGISLVMPGNITFDVGSAQIKPEFADVLNSVAIVLKEYKNSAIEISGHCDDRGNMERNQLLSQQRANAVASYLRVKGVRGSRITAIGYGKSSSTGSRDMDRRVEIQISE